MLALFFLMSLILIVSAIGVVSFLNPLHSALCLIVNLLTVAGLFAALDAHFLATVQIIVYAGAIMVLVIFLIMLLNIKYENPQQMSISFISLAVIGGAGFLYVLLPIINDAFKVFPESAVAVEGTVENIGKLLYTEYVFPFEAASVLILAAIVGAVMIAKKKSQKEV